MGRMGNLATNPLIRSLEPEVSSTPPSDLPRGSLGLRGVCRSHRAEPTRSKTGQNGHPLLHTILNPVQYAQNLIIRKIRVETGVEARNATRTRAPVQVLGELLHFLKRVLVPLLDLQGTRFVALRMYAQYICKPFTTMCLYQVPSTRFVAM